MKSANNNLRFTWLLIICFVFFIFLIIALPEKSKQQASKTIATTQNIVIRPAKPSEYNKSNIIVKSLIVKKVDGKFRYFFDIRNKGVENFNGSVSIYLYGFLENPLGIGTFETEHPIEPTLGTYKFIDINTGTPLIHGEYGITKFKYEVKVNNAVMKSGEGKITEKYEDLSY